MAGRGSAPGERRGGRQKGTQNKINADLKTMLREALDKAGGTDYLFGQALNNPSAFMTLLGKTIPADVNNKLMGPDGEKLEVNINITHKPHANA